MESHVRAKESLSKDVLRRIQSEDVHLAVKSMLNQSPLIACAILDSLPSVVASQMIGMLHLKATLDRNSRAGEICNRAHKLGICSITQIVDAIATFPDVRFASDTRRQR